MRALWRLCRQFDGACAILDEKSEHMGKRDGHYAQLGACAPIIKVLVLAAATAFSAPAYARSVKEFDIPSQVLSAALREFARQSGQQLVYSDGDVRMFKSRAIRNRQDAETALDAMLAGTGLSRRVLPSGLISIGFYDKAENAATRPVPVDVVPVAPMIVVVKGLQASLQSAMLRKENATGFRDSIVAEDIGKLPDSNVPEALQRIPGIQIGRDHGEGAGVAIRGLSQVKTLLNGREIFSDTARDMAFDYLPTEVISGIDVYKNPSAAMVEGGVGGVVDLRTHAPFDFQNFALIASARAANYDFLGETRPQISALISKRFTTSIGEIGVLVTVADIRSAGRLDSVGIEPFVDRYDIVDFNNNGIFPGLTPVTPGYDAGDRVISPNGGGGAIEITERHRTSIDAVIQWHPSEASELKLEFTRFNYAYRGNAKVIYANRGTLLPTPGAVFTFADPTEDSPNVVQSGSYTGVGVTSNSNYFDRIAETDQVSLSTKWTLSSGWRLNSGLSYSLSRRDDAAGNIRIGNTPTSNTPTLAFDLRGARPSLQLSGFDYADSAQYHLIEAGHYIGRGTGESLTENVSVKGTFGHGALKSFEAGVRFSERTVRNQQGSRAHMTGDRPLSVLPIAGSSLVYDNFYRGLIDQYLLRQGTLGAPFSLLRDRARICTALGDTVCTPSFNPLSTYSAAEGTAAVYGEASYAFQIGRLPVTGTLGARYVTTQLKINGYRTSNSAVSQPLTQKTVYGNWLPSFNARIRLRDHLLLRIAAAKQMTRPNFADLAPNLTLSVSPSTTLIGRAGNPDLRPLKATSYDASIEYYADRSTYAYITVFQKNVEGFLQTVTDTEAVAFPDFANYTTAQIARPQNGGKGVIKGYELGFQSFLDFLPTPFDGLGVQANYTQIGSRTPGAIAGTSVPLVSLSKNSYNLVAYFENTRTRARLAYSYRDNYVDTISGIGSGNLPIYARPFGTLDLSLSYKMTTHLDFTIDATNLLRSEMTSYFGNIDRPRFYTIYDRRFSATLRFTY